MSDLRIELMSGLLFSFYFGLLLLFVSTARMRRKDPWAPVLFNTCFSLLFIGSHFYFNFQLLRLADVYLDTQSITERFDIDPAGDSVVSSRLLASVVFDKTGAKYRYSDDDGSVHMFEPSLEELRGRERYLTTQAEWQLTKEITKGQMRGSAVAVAMFAISGFFFGRTNAA